MNIVMSDILCVSLMFETEDLSFFIISVIKTKVSVDNIPLHYVCMYVCVSV